MFIAAERAAAGAAGAIGLDHAGAQLPGDALSARVVAALHVIGQAIAGVVGDFDRLVLALERDDRQHRAENLLTRDAHVVVDVGEHRRPHEIAAVEAFRPAGATSDQARALVDAGLDQVLHLLELHLGDQRPDVVALLGRLADGGRLGSLAGHLDGLVIDRAFDQHARRRVTGLTGVVEAMQGAALDRAGDIAIGEDDVGAFTAQFQGHPLDRLGGRLGDRDAGPGRAGEAHHVDVGMMAHGLADGRPVAIDQVEDPGRETGLFHHFGEQHRRHRRDFGRFEDHRATDPDRRHHF